MEQRAMLIKRLSFVIFSSDVDQYERQLHQIKGILQKDEHLKLIHVLVLIFLLAYLKTDQTTTFFFHIHSRLALMLFLQIF